MTRPKKPRFSPPICRLLGLSDELLLLVVNCLDRHDDLPSFRKTCRKFKEISDDYFFRNLAITLSEEPTEDKWRLKLVSMPEHINKTRHLTILNQCIYPGGYFYRGGVPRPNSYRILRWEHLEANADECSTELASSAFLVGVQFYWNVRLSNLQSLRWRHATAISLKNLGVLMAKHIASLTTLEISMIQPPSTASVRDFEMATGCKSKTIPKLRILRYDGLSHTEPIPQNRPERGGRFRMIRPIFRSAKGTLEELTLSQDHCVSQVGKTPLINGRTYDAFLCDLDEIYLNPSRSSNDHKEPVVLNLSKLSLGGFKVAKLFNMPSSALASPRVRVTLSPLRCLILNDCDGLALLLRHLESRKDELRLVEFGIRVREDPEAFEDYAEACSAVDTFLTCFKGLQVFSMLWDGPNSPDESLHRNCLRHHHQTLQVYAVSTRDNSENDELDAHGRTLRFVNQPSSVFRCDVLPVTVRPDLREFAFDLAGPANEGDYRGLKLLSQFDNLRTAHIRNFPPIGMLRTHDDDEGSMTETAPTCFWRDEEGTLTQMGRAKAAEIAEMIALPFCGLPPGWVPNDETTCELQKLADVHASHRDQELLGGVKLKSMYKSSTPLPDFTYRVLEQRADIDPQFATVKRQVEDNVASLEDATRYYEYVNKVDRALGRSPPIHKPKLRLLIIGDWRYRDQMNLTGPRTWDPDAWCIEKGTGLDPPSEDEDDYMDDSNGAMQYRLRRGFKKEFDVCLLPVFFKIEWEAVQREKDPKWRWTARVEELKQTTLEGYGALGDVKSLDFAWQN